MSDLNRFKVNVGVVPEDELETALRVLTRSFNIFSIVIKHGGVVHP